MSVRMMLTLLLFATACADPKPANDPSNDGQPFPSEGPRTSTRPSSGRCMSDIDCKGNGMECLFEGKGKGVGTCVRMDPAMAPNGTPSGPGYGTPRF